MQLKTSPNIAWRRVEREIVILKTDSGKYYSLANAGADAWEWLAVGLALKTVGACLAKSYLIAPARADQDVAALVSKLKKYGLLEPSSVQTKSKSPRVSSSKFSYSKPQLTRHASLEQKSYAWATY
ncbi:MAG: hypothetical protein A3J74_01470 [Elusimicrobia bacterium RIFCSPHIGHO2_02_FULL_57_9]|nr:MAG: hypothetical protein A3J74_01470 [Elusimicrobia bacterium RIFCSPHIGHO2_02_FULL_57_9]